MRRILGALLAAAMFMPAMAAEPAKPKGWRPRWGESLPETTPAGSIGVMAFQMKRNICEVAIRFDNGTDQTIKTVHGRVEMFFAKTSVIEPFAVQFVDPGKHRDGSVIRLERCPDGVSRLLIRDITLCDRGRVYWRGCGVPVKPIAPRLERQVNQIPIEVSPDFDK